MAAISPPHAQPASNSNSRRQPASRTRVVVTTRCAPTLDRWCPMAHARNVQTVVLNSLAYLAARSKALRAQSETSETVAMLAADPKCGDLMRETGGFRKVRVRVGNRGKSGGARVVYIYRDESFPVFLITVFAKNEKANLTKGNATSLRSVRMTFPTRTGGRP